MTNEQLIILVRNNLPPSTQIDLTSEGHIRIVKPMWLTIGPVDQCDIKVNDNQSITITHKSLTVELYNNDWQSPFIHIGKL